MDDSPISAPTNDLFVRAFHTSPVAIAISTVAEGRFVEVNESFLHKTGYTRGEVIGHTSRELNVWGDIGERAGSLQQLRTHSAIQNLEILLRTKAGALRWVLASLELIDVAGEACLLSTFQDITERKATEAALRQSEERAQLITRATSDAIWDWDLVSHEVRWSQGLRTVFGYPDEALRHHNWWAEHVHPDDRVQTEASVRLAITRGERFWAGEYRFRRADDVYAYVLDRGYVIHNEQGQAVRMVGAMVDISERKVQEQALHDREQQYRSIFEAVSDGLMIHDLDGGYVDFNPAICRMCGYSEAEFRQLHAGQLIHPVSRAQLHQLEATVKTTGHFHQQAVWVRKDGTTFVADMRAQPFLYHGQPHVLIIVRDVSEEAAAYHLLEQRVEERTQQLSTLLQVSRQIALTLELEPLLDLILEQLQTVVEYQGASILSLEGETLIGRAYRGPKPKAWISQFSMPVDNFIDRQVLANRQPYLIPDMWEDTPATRYFRAALGERFETLYADVRSWLRIPLIARDQVVGMLSLHHPEPNYFSSRQIDLALAFANQAAIAIENARLYEQARQFAAVEERQRLARELHDSVSQALYGIALGARTARTLLDRDASKVVGPLDYVLQLAEAGLAEMRALIFELRPESLVQEGLVVALSKQAASLRARHQIEVETDFCPEPEVAFERKEALYRIAQEALHNVVKHARATRVELRLAQRDGVLLLAVQDNGQGFDPAGEFAGHLGLKSMRERALQLGGAVTIHSAPGQGARVVAQVPIHY
jgi:PAS domain S-box-containing protein